MHKIGDVLDYIAGLLASPPAAAKLIQTGMMTLPADFIRRIVDQHGDAGRAWLDDLPGLIKRYAKAWSLRVGSPLPSASQNFVVLVNRRDGLRAVLKAGVPGPEITAEIDALRLMDGRGSVRLLESDAASGTLLLERLIPGTELATLCPEKDEEATSIAATVMRRLWRAEPARHSFPRVTDWIAGFRARRFAEADGSSPLPASLVDRADRLFEELIQSPEEPVVLHGDLHHRNILAAEREPWLAIDPKGVIGERAFEVGALLRNPMPELLAFPGLARILARRIDQLSEELGFDKQRLIAWSTAQAVLAASWDLEDHGDGWQRWIVCAEQLVSIAA